MYEENLTVIMMKFGVVLWNWYSLSDALKYTKKAIDICNFQKVWFCDNLPYWNIYVTLSAIASKLKVPLGTMVTYPYIRNPIDIACAFASISNLLEGREVSMGFGRGGGVLGSIIKSRKPLTTLRESVRMMRMLLDGKHVEFKEFPFLTSMHGMREEAGTKLRVLPKTYIPIYIGASGLRAVEIAGGEADGLIIGSLNTLGSIVGIEKEMGFMEKALETLEKSRKNAGVAKPPTKIYNTWIAVSENERQAINAAKHHLSYGIAQSPDSDLPPLGINLEIANGIREIYNKGFGPDEAAKAVPDELVNLMAIAGTPRKCVDTLERILPKLEKWGFEQITIGLALGLDVEKSLEILGRDVLPSFM